MEDKSMERERLVDCPDEEEELTLPTSLTTTAQSKTPISPPNVKLSSYYWRHALEIKSFIYVDLLSHWQWFTVPVARESQQRSQAQLCKREENNRTGEREESQCREEEENPQRWDDVPVYNFSTHEL